MSGRCRPTDPFGESHVNMPMYTGATHAAVQRLFQRPWFFRTWVIQEKVLSKEAIVCCGPESASWKDILAGIGYSIELIDRPLQGLKYGDRAHRIHKLRPSTNSRELFQHSRHCQATDPKDRVYGILGSLKPGLIKVNYEADVQEIYRSFTQAIIQDEESICVLNLCGTSHSLPGLPSWVPDFSVGRSSSHLPGLGESGGPRRIDRSESHLTKVLPGMEFRNDGKQLVVKGKAVDTVRVVGDEMPVSMEYAIGTEKFCKIISEWESLAAQNVLSQDLNTYWTSDDPQGSVSNAVLETLIALNAVVSDDYNLPEMPIGGVLWYEQHGMGALSKRESQYFEDVECSTILGQGDENDDRCGAALSRSYQCYIRRLELAVYGRKLFVTEGGAFGLGDPEVQPGDEIVFLPGSPYPFAIRAFDGDTFTLLGDCYVHGFDVSKLFEDHKKPIRDYVFR